MVIVPNPWITNPASFLASKRLPPAAVEYGGVGLSILEFTDNFSTLNLTNWGQNAGVTISGNTCMINPGGKIQYNGSTRWSMVNSAVSLCINQLPDNAHYMLLYLGSQLSSMYFELEIGVALGMKCQLANDVGVTVFSSTTPYLLGRMNWIRMRESDGTVFWDYSADGIVWVTAYSYNHTGCAGMSAVVPVINPQSGATGPLIISRFNLPAPAPTAPGLLAPYTPTRTPVIANLMGLTAWPRGLPVTAQTPHAPYGSTSGGYTFTSTATGSKSPQGTGAGQYSWAATASGSKTEKGSGSGIYGWAATATGITARSGSAVGFYGWAATASGAKDEKASGSGRYGWAATATGTTLRIGSGATTYGWAASTTGTTSRYGSGATTYGWAASTTGKRISAGAAEPENYTWVTAASGQRIPLAATATRYGWASTVVGYQGLAIAAADKDRMLMVARENRVLVVKPENRVLVVAPENRILIV